MDEMTGLEILRDLVSINTVNPPGNEKAAAVYLKELLEPAGFSCTVRDLGDGRANFLAQLGRGDGPELIFNGHLDVVPAAGRWETDPFELAGMGDKVYGRGVCDMKGGLAAMCRAALSIAGHGGPEHGTLKLLFVADEEDANRGIMAYLREREAGEAGAVCLREREGAACLREREAGEADALCQREGVVREAGAAENTGRTGRNDRWESYAVIGEPTNLEVAVAHRGVTRSYVDIRGAARHAALPEDGNSSIEKLPGVLHAITKMNRELETRTHPVLPPPGISVTMVKAYEKDNVVPGKVLTDFRILPDMEEAESEALLRNAIAAAGIPDVQIMNHFFMPGGEISPEDDFVTLCCETAGQVRNQEVVPQAFDASCEQCFLIKAGIKTVILGPGSLDQAHTRDEFLALEQLEQAARIYEGIAWEVLGAADGQLEDRQGKARQAGNGSRLRDQGEKENNGREEEYHMGSADTGSGGGFGHCGAQYKKDGGRGGAARAGAPSPHQNPPVGVFCTDADRGRLCGNHRRQAGRGGGDG